MGQFVDITGQRYGTLIAIHPTERRTKGGGYIWRFKCDCGNTKDIPANSVRTGMVKSCGCQYKYVCEQDKRLFTIWVNMRQRCSNPNSPNYNRYGARGIKVCDDWESFKKFRKWSIQNGYNDSLTIDRIDNDCGYNPGNCRWTTVLQQQRNRGNNHLITYKGETRCLSEWSEILGISRMAIMLRLSRYGYTVEEAFTKPVRKTKATKAQHR